MRYKVSFRKRFNAKGEPIEHPVDSLSVPEGVVQEALIVETEEPPSLHTGENMEEDDDFLSLRVEVWEFDIAPGREEEFLHALRNSRTALEYEVIDETSEAA